MTQRFLCGNTKLLRNASDHTSVDTPKDVLSPKFPLGQGPRPEESDDCITVSISVFSQDFNSQTSSFSPPKSHINSLGLPLRQGNGSFTGKVTGTRKKKGRRERPTCLRAPMTVIRESQEPHPTKGSTSSPSRSVV